MPQWDVYRSCFVFGMSRVPASVYVTKMCQASHESYSVRSIKRCVKMNIFKICVLCNSSCVIGYRVTEVQLPAGAKDLSLFPKRPNLLWHPSGLLSNRYRMLFPPEDKAAEA
jgi:hypothetical protein